MNRKRAKPSGTGMIIRHKHKGHFTTVPNSIFEDDRLSPAAKGVLGFLLSRPPDWQVRQDHLARKLKIGRKLLRKCREELVDAGYLTCGAQQGRDESNRFTALNCVVSDRPDLSNASQPQRPTPPRERDTGNKEREIKTDLNNSPPTPLGSSAERPKSRQKIVYSDFGSRAAAAGNHPVFVNSKPYLAWLKFRGPDGMPGFVDEILIAGRCQQVVWMPSVYPPKQTASTNQEEDWQ